MNTEEARAYVHPSELLEALDAAAHVAALDMLAAVIAHDAAGKLTASLTEALTAAEAEVVAWAKRADETAATVTDAARAVREAHAACALLEPLAEALEAGRADEVRQEAARLDEARQKAEAARNEATGEANLAAARLTQARTAAAALVAKLAALATVPEPDADALAPLVAALRAPGGKR